MLRTNQTFLDYLEGLYRSEEHKGNIVLESFEKGDKILVQNQISTKIMLVKSGITKCYFVEENGKEYIVEFMGKGEIIGEIEVIKNVPCICSIEAITEVTVYSMSIPYFQALIKKDLTLNNLLLDVFAERIFNTSSRASYQQLHKTEHTLSQLLEVKSREMEISKEDMATYLGTTVESLNRALEELQENNSEE
ncbi:Crp/Fnr family transcriptional regulator [Chryseobacterium gambrini]|uniref:Crp/Fnr family transcriptional regulator n=2 Tax=Chryseobacterium TaxID=59732 RepID=A0AAJ1R6Z2_9FLAO|nr:MULTISPECIES: Crp/Fnr family transcriptional regulator [Chryseobacterium]HAO06480.1 Crp/Fnr family transcriptional regulator [Chryseobacterium sp.]MCF2219224.1 Crp/Fnr family transcriptional regulator [Chryseobacterium sp. PS-8]MDN4015135.1 Crp/Fnr family transcriptional regulator [Chryseobacterium gambrini]MDN4029296.1 Crp/Fnr family transcriptional regulator [Chryseobacterium gambrini]QWA39038.1 Crp/Fnr family transcriptional regulator [Chryseobacterium sp. ZHDP1]